MRRRAASAIAAALALFLLASCGQSREPKSNDSRGSRSDEGALAHAAWASLVATFTETQWKLPRMHGNSDTCLNERKNGQTSRIFDDPVWDNYEDGVFCSLNRSAMTHLLRRLDRGLGTVVTARQKTCINRKVTRDQVATVLTAAQAGRHDLAAVGPELDDQLASAIRQCRRN